MSDELLIRLVNQGITRHQHRVSSVTLLPCQRNAVAFVKQQFNRLPEGNLLRLIDAGCVWG